jgi:hypothetical protein
MGDPIPIYRFLDADGALKTLVSGRFRVGQLSKFNDPFEWRLGFAGAVAPEEQKFAEDFSSAHLVWLESWMGILCFSDSVSDPVLWALYAQKHRGVAFEVRYPWPSGNIQQMRYSNERPVLDFNQLRAHRDPGAREQYLTSLLGRLMNQKSLGFSFEREYRLHIDLNDRGRCQSRDGQYEWQLPDGSLKRVVLGFRCPLEEAAVRKLLDMNGLVDTKVVRARMCSQSYAIIT